MDKYEEIIVRVAKTLIKAGSTFREDKKEAYLRAIRQETSLQSKWVLETLLENAVVAEENKGPLCDDTGIPHLFLEAGRSRSITGEMLSAIYKGIEEGLRTLPGRPMAICGNDIQRIDQSGGLNPDPAALEPAPLLIKLIDEDVLRLHIIMEGGGPAIRGRTYRIFHKHNINVVRDEIVDWSIEAVKNIGCSPCTLAIGIGRSHYEASAMMIEAQVYGRYNVQSDIEDEITTKVNEAHIGALGLKGDVSVIATFLKVGPQRASGVRIVCLRPCCCFEPRIASVEL
jgi:fumarate hydratase subunit alpha